MLPQCSFEIYRNNGELAISQIVDNSFSISTDDLGYMPLVSKAEVFDVNSGITYARDTKIYAITEYGEKIPNEMAISKTENLPVGSYTLSELYALQPWFYSGDNANEKISWTLENVNGEELSTSHIETDVEGNKILVLGEEDIGKQFNITATYNYKGLIEYSDSTITEIMQS